MRSSHLSERRLHSSAAIAGPGARHDGVGTLARAAAIGSGARAEHARDEPRSASRASECGSPGITVSESGDGIGTAEEDEAARNRKRAARAH
jgi:hypothetical protein